MRLDRQRLFGATFRPQRCRPASDRSMTKCAVLWVSLRVRGPGPYAGSTRATSARAPIFCPSRALIDSVDGAACSSWDQLASPVEPMFHVKQGTDGENTARCTPEEPGTLLVVVNRGLRPLVDRGPADSNDCRWRQRENRRVTAASHSADNPDSTGEMVRGARAVRDSLIHMKQGVPQVARSWRASAGPGTWALYGGVECAHAM
jgi:hypothetical protein